MIGILRIRCPSPNYELKCSPLLSGGLSVMIIGGAGGRAEIRVRPKAKYESTECYATVRIPSSFFTAATQERESMNFRTLAREERADLAAFLKSLSPEQWEAPTLCAEWRVRDVVAHLLSYDELDRGALMQRFAKGRFVLDRVNAVGVAEYNRRSPEELAAFLDAHLEPSGLPAAFGGMVSLIDGTIHHQDIRRPLGIPRDIPPERLLATLRCALFAPAVRGFWRARGVRLVATDLDWSFGRGPEVRGRAEALLMTMAGRRGVVGELSGPGQPKLAHRLEA
jgi:uncharacterized protein (TIGR03083 family)